MANAESQTSQFSLFKDCIARKMLQFQGNSSPDSSSDDTSSSLDDFASYLATEAWSNLPAVVKDASYETREAISNAIPDPMSEESLPLESTSAGFTDSLVSYGLVTDDEDALKLLRKVLVDYLEQACAPPPPWKSTRTKDCEICEREIPLTYHHLIPRSTHAKVLKKGWHPEAMINSVAWLCRPCHSVVHQAAKGEDLARHFYTVELLLEREDIQKWRKYAAKQRFGIKRG